MYIKQVRLGSRSVDGIGSGGCRGKLATLDSCWFPSISLSRRSSARSCCARVSWSMMTSAMELVDFEDVGTGSVVSFAMVRIEGAQG